MAPLFNRKIAANGWEIFYREAGDRNKRAVLLLHGFPTSSVMFKTLMTALFDDFYLVAPDYPGFGFSAFPSKDDFKYSFPIIAGYMYAFTEAIGLERFSIFLNDYGCPIGLRVCVEHPEKIERMIVMNGNAYEEGAGPQWDEILDYWYHPTPEKKAKVYAFLSEEGTKAQYAAGLPDDLLPRVAPETWKLGWQLMLRPGNLEMQYILNCDYLDNMLLFPVFQLYFRTFQPPALIIWGRYDPYFNVEEAHCYQRDIPHAEVHILDGSHMLLETHYDEVLPLMREFLN